MLEIIIKGNKGLAKRHGVQVKEWHSSWLYDDALEIKELLVPGDTLTVTGDHSTEVKQMLRDLGCSHYCPLEWERPREL